MQRGPLEPGVRRCLDDSLTIYHSIGTSDVFAFDLSDCASFVKMWKALIEFHLAGEQIECQLNDEERFEQQIIIMMSC